MRVINPKYSRMISGMYMELKVLAARIELMVLYDATTGLRGLVVIIINDALLFLVSIFYNFQHGC
jgi:hypothetical protein